MRLSEHARSVVRPRDAWIAVAIVVVLLGAMGIDQMLGGHLPSGAPWFWGGALILYWVAMLVPAFRYGRRALTWQRLIFPLGYTLFMVGQLWMHPPEAISWLANIGLLFVVGGMLAPYVEFGKKRDTPSPDPLLHKEQE